MNCTKCKKELEPGTPGPVCPACVDAADADAESRAWQRHLAEGKSAPAEPALGAEDAPTTPERIRKACFKIAEMLIAKNKSYGDSALKPTGIFGKGRAIDLIHVRIDDKLNRIKNQPGAFGDNDVDDLIGYLILLKLAREDEAEAKTQEVKS